MHEIYIKESNGNIIIEMKNPIGKFNSKLDTAKKDFLKWKTR